MIYHYKKDDIFYSVAAHIAAADSNECLLMNGRSTNALADQQLAFESMLTDSDLQHFIATSRKRDRRKEKDIGVVKQRYCDRDTSDQPPPPPLRNLATT